MNKKVILIILINTIFGAGDFPDYGPGQQWTTFGSTTQGFIIFDGINFNDEPIASGTLAGAYGECDENDCDILGLMYNGQCIGWSYLPTSENGQITIAANLKDANTPQVQGYPQVVPGVYSPIITYNFYDASESIIYYNVGSVVPIAGNQINDGILDITGSGTVCSTDGFAFGTPDEYCLLGIGCNSSNSEYFDAIGNELLDCDGLEVEAIEGCTNLDACNYNILANINNDSCDFPEENYDCDENCIVELDCAEVCGGATVVDECGICDGDNADKDCADVCFGSSIVDCAGICGGATVVDECGICDGNCVGDGNCNEEDICGTCYGDGPEEFYNCDNTCINDTNDNGYCDELEEGLTLSSYVLNNGNNLIGYFGINGDDDDSIENILGNQIDDIRFIVGQGVGTFIENIVIEGGIPFFV